MGGGYVNMRIKNKTLEWSYLEIGVGNGTIIGSMEVYSR